MALNEKTADEKRDFVRMSINSHVDIRYAGNSYPAVCKNLSGAGMSLETIQSFDIGTVLQITIQQENTKLQPFVADASVARVDAGQDGKFMIGLSITEIFD